MKGILTSIVVTAVLAGIAAIPAHFAAQAIQRRRKGAKPPYWPFVIALAVAVGGATILSPYLVSFLRSMSNPMATWEQTFPIYKTIREHEPALYDNLRREVVRMKEAGLSRAEMADGLRAKVSEYVTTNMALAPDDVLVRLMAVAVKEGEALASINPRLCVGLLMGRPVGDVALYIPDDLETEDSAAMEALILAPKEAGRPALDEATGMQVSVDIIKRKSAETSIPLEDFGMVEGTDADPRRACAALVAYLHGVIELPQDQAAALLRWSSQTQ